MKMWLDKHEREYYNWSEFWSRIGLGVVIILFSLIAIGGIWKSFELIINLFK